MGGLEMARVIEINFNDKTYLIEYNRRAVLNFMASQTKESDDFASAVKLIKCGLLKHHEKEMPSDDEIFGWVILMGEDAKAFVSALKDSVQEVIEVIKAEKEKSGFKWGVRN